MALRVLDDREECEDEQLKRYAAALRHFAPVLNSSLVTRISPKALIEKHVATDAGSSALDRLLLWGCDPERFVHDAEYRVDTLEGLAVMEEAEAWRDALELAASFGVPAERLHLASLQNAVESLTPEEAERLIEERGHKKHLSPEQVQELLGWTDF